MQVDRVQFIDGDLVFFVGEDDAVASFPLGNVFENQGEPDYAYVSVVLSEHEVGPWVMLSASTRANG